MDLPSTFKYERNLGAGEDVRNIREGVSFERLFTLLGNSDAHGKNLSMHVRPAGLVPAPMYDLVSVNAYGEHVERDVVHQVSDFVSAQANRLLVLAREVLRVNPGR